MRLANCAPLGAASSLVRGEAFNVEHLAKRDARGAKRRNLLRAPSRRRSESLEPLRDYILPCERSEQLGRIDANVAQERSDWLQHVVGLSGSGAQTGRTGFCIQLF